MKENKYLKDLEIDENMLEREWIDQSSLYMSYSIEAAEAGKHKDDIKEELEIIRAQTSLRIREDSEKKMTEAMVASAITLDENCQTAVSNYNQAVYEYNMIQAVIKSLDHKKKALENLVQLWVNGYYSVPKSVTMEEKKVQAASTSQRTKLNTPGRKNERQKRTKEQS